MPPDLVRSGPPPPAQMPELTPAADVAEVKQQAAEAGKERTAEEIAEEQYRQWEAGEALREKAEASLEAKYAAWEAQQAEKEQQEREIERGRKAPQKQVEIEHDIERD